MNYFSYNAELEKKSRSFFKCKTPNKLKFSFLTILYILFNSFHLKIKENNEKIAFSLYFVILDTTLRTTWHLPLVKRFFEWFSAKVCENKLKIAIRNANFSENRWNHCWQWKVIIETKPMEYEKAFVLVDSVVSYTLQFNLSQKKAMHNAAPNACRKSALAIIAGLGNY